MESRPQDTTALSLEQLPDEILSQIFRFASNGDPFQGMQTYTLISKRFTGPAIEGIRDAELPPFELSEKYLGYFAVVEYLLFGLCDYVKRKSGKFKPSGRIFIIDEDRREGLLLKEIKAMLSFAEEHTWRPTPISLRRYLRKYFDNDALIDIFNMLADTGLKKALFNFYQEEGVLIEEEIHESYRYILYSEKLNGTIMRSFFFQHVDIINSIIGNETDESEAKAIRKFIIKLYCLSNPNRKELHNLTQELQSVTDDLSSYFTDNCKRFI